MTSKKKVALVTAAAGAGIGAATARQLAFDGFDVVITDAHEKRCVEFGQKLTREFDCEFLTLTLDVTDWDQVQKVMNRVKNEKGRLDILVNNAGWSRIEPVAEMARETWLKCIDVDLNGTFNCMRHALPIMQENRSGAIINISSIAAWETNREHGAAYSAAKSAIHDLTRVTAAENGKHGIRVNAVAPGLIYNDFLRKIYPPDFFEGYIENKSLLNRVGEPQDIANIVSFLVSDKAGYVTGEVYGVSGGVCPGG